MASQMANDVEIENTFLKEVRVLRNPALGAFLMYRLALAYSQENELAENAPINLLFLVLPILYYRDTHDIVSSTQKKTGLSGYAAKFVTNNRSDVLLFIHDRAVEMRELSYDALRSGTLYELFQIDKETGRVIAATRRTSESSIPKSVEAMGRQADKLGIWFSKLSLLDISSYLKVAF